MLTITPKINTNNNFKAASSNQTVSLRLAIEAITAEEVIPKDTLESSASRNLFKRFTKSLKYKNLLFKLRLLRPVNKKYDKYENLREVHYKNGAYRKYENIYESTDDRIWIIRMINKKRGTGLSRCIYEKKLPDGTIKTYSRGKLESKTLPDGTKIVYFKNGHVKEKYDPKGKLIESNQV